MVQKNVNPKSKISRNLKFIGYSLIFYLVIGLSNLFFPTIFTGFYMYIINLSMIYVILTVSLNLINGFTGQFSIGHMGFAGVGAYVSGTITTLLLKLSVPALTLSNLSLGSVANVVGVYGIFVVSLIIGGIAAAMVGILIGFPTLRLRGDYLAIVTLGFGEIIRTVFNNIDAVGGPRGLLGIPKFSNFTVILLFTIITIFVIRNLIYSTHGRALLSIRENELASELVGINTTKFKITAFTIGSFFAGIAGGLLCHLITLAHPTQYGFLYSIMVLIMLYTGGMGSISGSLVAAFALTFLLQGLKIALPKIGDLIRVPIGDQWSMVIYSVLLILVMLYKTEGIMGNKEFKVLVPEEEELK